MEYRFLGTTGLRVSAVSFGTSTFGSRGMGGGATADEAQALVDTALEAGINLFDTADIYSGGEAESELARCLGTRRDDVLISTKAGIPAGPGQNSVGASRRHLTRQLEGSLRRLGTDYVDIFYVHFQDEYTSIEEQAHTLGGFVSSGKARVVAVANHAAWRVALMVEEARRLGCPGLGVYQGLWNLFSRDIEHEVVPLCAHEGIGVIAWGPLAGGLLSGKYRPGAPRPEGARLAGDGAYFGLEEARVAAVLPELDRLAAASGRTVGQLSLAWLLSHPALSSVTVGARTPEQLRENAAAAGTPLTADERSALDELAPAVPHWPQWHLEWRKAWRTPD